MALASAVQAVQFSGSLIEGPQERPKGGQS